MAAAVGLNNAFHHQKTRQKNSVRRRCSLSALVMTASLFGILLTWTLTMKWISTASTSSSSHASSTASEITQNGILLDQTNWKVAAKSWPLKEISGLQNTRAAPKINTSSPMSNFTSTSTSPLDKIKVPFPIFIPSLPKSGTTSLHRYFICGKIWTAHTFVNTQDFRQLRVGECMQNNIKEEKAPFDTCGTYKVFSDAGFIRGNRCYYPSLHGALPALAESYKGHGKPRSVGTNGGGFTLLYIRRSKEAWIQSMRHWKDGNLLRKWKVCPEPFPRHNQTVTDEQWMEFYEYHAKTIRQFAKDHAETVTFIEVHLEDEDIAQQLEAKIGINASCWGHHNSHEKRLKLNPKFRAKALELQEQQPQQEQQQGKTT